ncbi:MAG: hypothetical protein ACT443_00670 [Gemmatimonadota bacterium]
MFRTILPVLALAAALPVQAQQIPSPYRFLDTSQEAGVFVAHVAPAKGILGLGSESGIAFGARYSIQLSGPFVIEAEAQYFPTSHVVLDTALVDSVFRVIGTADHSLITGTASLRVNLTGPRTWNKLQPFVQFGLGAVLEANRDQDAVDQAPPNARYELGTSFAGLLGLGVAWIPADRFAIRLDGRNLLWKIKTPAGLLDRRIRGAIVPTDEWVQNVGVSVGASILF